MIYNILSIRKAIVIVMCMLLRTILYMIFVHDALIIHCNVN